MLSLSLCHADVLRAGLQPVVHSQGALSSRLLIAYVVLQPFASDCQQTLRLITGGQAFFAQCLLQDNNMQPSHALVRLPPDALQEHTADCLARLYYALGTATASECHFRGQSTFKSVD